MLGQAWAGSPTAPGPGHPSARGFVPHSGSSASTERGLRPAGGVVLEPGSRPTLQNLSPHLGREVAPGEPTLIPAGCRRAWQRPGPAPGATEWSEPAHRGEGSRPGLLAPGPPHALPTRPPPHCPPCPPPAVLWAVACQPPGPTRTHDASHRRPRPRSRMATQQALGYPPTRQVGPHAPPAPASLCPCPC